ncbi:MAG TPA: S8 family serine peptidase [Prolixibacteraceae bacterium]|nr:S8 family serine peptidase [Prolixibacteraceae bacterium]HQE52889.1 S8 family serine peptidase [Prolixibacteraceae bacterium]
MPKAICKIFLQALIALSCCHSLHAQPVYRVDFTDKAQSPYSVDRPAEFLSQRSIQRRERQGIAIDETDLPVNRNYIDAVVKTGGIPLHTSRWLNALTVRLPHDSTAAEIAKLSFVRNVELTKPAAGSKSAFNKFGTPGRLNPIDTSRYGASVYQVGMLNGQALHQRGFTGKGILIAVLDAGFYRVDELPAFDSLRIDGRIEGTRDLVNPSADIYAEHTHGMMVLSCMGANLPGRLIGTAPHASYWLIRTEDGSSEYPVEEDTWIAGAELADSIGADIINSSLGYSEFDLATMNHRWADMDGKTTRVARGANMAAAKGMLVFSSAGNEARKPWRRIISPADGDSVIAVAAVNKESQWAPFSSVGPSSDGDVKPDLAAMGQNTAIQNTDGQIAANSGTSFASPVLAGMAASLWQAFPDAPAWKIKKALLQSGSLFLNPDSLLGYGIPDMETAVTFLALWGKLSPETGRRWAVFPRPFRESVTLLSLGIAPAGSGADPMAGITVEIFSMTGRKLMSTQVTGPGPHRIGGLDALPFGMWILRISGSEGSEVHKIMGGKRP